MLIIADLSGQIVTCFLGRSFRAKKSRAHVVVDSNNTRASFANRLTVSEPINPAGPVTMTVRI